MTKKIEMIGTIAAIADAKGIDPRKLINCIRETFPQAQFQSEISIAALDQAFTNFEQKHNIKGGPAPALHLKSGTAQSGVNREFIQPEEIKMENENNFYDEHAIDQESERQWAADPSVRQEFQGGGFESFKEYRRAEAQGLVKMLGSN